MQATPTRNRVYKFVKDYIWDKGFVPTSNEIATAMQISRHSANHHLRKLHEDGRITRGEHERQIDISDDGFRCLRCRRPL